MKKISILLFFVVVAAQLAVPVTMIVRKERVIANGKVFRFKTEPIDPADPFRGRYIDLRFEASDYKIPESDSSLELNGAFALIRENEEGYAEVASISKNPPEGTSDYVKIKADENSLFGSWFNSAMRFYFPFNRFYMDEKKAPAAETIYRRAQRDTNQVSFGLVSIWNGGGVITDVIINGKSARDITPEEMEQHEE